jgi:hypothetical protein
MTHKTISVACALEEECELALKIASDCDDCAILLQHNPLLLGLMSRAAMSLRTLATAAMEDGVAMGAHCDDVTADNA